MIPLKEAIRSGAWLHFSESKGDLNFRLKIQSFKRVNLQEVDNPDKVSLTPGAVWWLMGLEFINLTKYTVKHYYWQEALRIVDSDGYQFNYKSESHLGLWSSFSKSSGLNEFFAGEYIPKIKYKGAISFLLPDEPEMEYSITMHRGAVQEV